MHLSSRQRTPSQPSAIVVAFLALAIVIASWHQRSTPAHAAPTPNITLSTSDIDAPGSTEPVPQGIKSWLVKQAVELVAEAIRHGSRIFDLIVGQLDAKAAKAFRKHADDIADGLDDIARIPDLTVNIVREKLRYFLVEQLSMNPGTAGVIVEGVTYALGLLM